MHWHGRERSENICEPDRLIGGFFYYPCEECFGLGALPSGEQPRLLRQRIAKAVYAKLSARGESIFQVLHRLNTKAGDPPINRQHLESALTGVGNLFIVFPDGLLVRTARNVVRGVEHGC